MSETISQHETEWFIIREDSPEVIKDLNALLTEQGLHPQMNLAPGCSSGSCAMRYVLLVSRHEVNAGLQLVDEYMLQAFPELRQARQLELENKCPACGHQNEADSRECADCGLALIIG